MGNVVRIGVVAPEIEWENGDGITSFQWEKAYAHPYLKSIPSTIALAGFTTTSTRVERLRSWLV